MCGELYCAAATAAVMSEQQMGCQHLLKGILLACVSVPAAQHTLIAGQQTVGVSLAHRVRRYRTFGYYCARTKIPQKKYKNGKNTNQFGLVGTKKVPPVPPATLPVDVIGWCGV